ncbi:MAG: UDP-3-O-(3-hydroxymyristoyl)glucosamine N-acyltransferase [Runella sp.]
MEFTVKQIAGLLGGDIEGEENLTISQLAKIEEGKTGSIAFLANQKYEPYLYTTEASAVIVNRTLALQKPINTTLIRVDNAYAAFAQLLKEYERLTKNQKVGIEQPAYIGENTQTGEGIYLGAFAYIGRNCQIGKNVKIYPQAWIGDNATIGDNTEIHAGVKIYPNTVIGQDCIIYANAVIGSDGFGFAPQPDGTYQNIPQLGNVVIENNVCIGAGTTIDCATIGSTIIREGVKLDNLIQIAHNVEIGQHTVIAAQTGVAGSTKIGKNCVIAGQVGIVGHIVVPDRTQVGAQSGISKNWETEGLSLNGSPAMLLKDSLRSLAVIRKLPDLEKKLIELEKKLNQLT